MSLFQVAARGWGLFSLYIYLENFKKKSCQKPPDRFQYNLKEMLLWQPSAKIVQAIMIHQKAWLPGGRAYFPYMSIQKTLKIFLAETTGLMSVRVSRYDILVTLYQDC